MASSLSIYLNKSHSDSMCMVEVHDIHGKLLYTDTQHSDTSELWCDGVDLREADFRGWDLSYAYFSDCDLSGARFDGADMHSVAIFRCEVEDTSFRECDMSGADITDLIPYLDRIDFEYASVPFGRRPHYM